LGDGVKGGLILKENVKEEKNRRDRSNLKKRTVQRKRSRVKALKRKRKGT
jgi:hypothetical protein